MCQGPSTDQAAPSTAAAHTTPPTNNTTSTPMTNNTAVPSKSRKVQDPAIIAGKEAIGRKIAIWSDKAMDWPEAVIAQFNADAAEHLVRFTERINGSVKHEEKWIKLSKTRFQWLTKPSVDAPANPTNANAPRGEDAVGYRVRVFWPGMARWYQGKIEEYNPTTKRHTVKYRDGDVQELMLKHEAIVYLNKTSSSSRPAKPRPASGGKPSTGKRARPSSADNGKKKDSNSAKKRKNSTTAAYSGSSQAHDDDEYDDDDGMEESSTQESDMDDDDDEEENDSGAYDSDDVHVAAAHRKGRALGSVQRKQTNKKSTKSSRKLSTNKKQAVADTNAIPARRRGRPPGSISVKRSLRGGMSGARGCFASRGINTRINTVDDEVIRAAGSVVVGARVAIFWNDESYYKGKLIQFDSYHKRHKILYDDGEEEWVALSREYFRYLTPKMQSGGCDEAFQQAMAQLGADQSMGTHDGSQNINNNTSNVDGGDGVNNTTTINSVVQQQRKAPLPQNALIHSLAGKSSPQGQPTTEPTPSAESAPGWRISLRSAGDKKWYAGEVLSYNEQKKKHLILYDDGEDEWVSLFDEEVVYHSSAVEDKAGIFPGKPFNVEAPSGRDAIGWRVAVYWPGDAAFYPGEIAGYEESTNRHEISYDDSEEGAITIGEDRVKWILPPGVAVDHENLERLEVGGGRPRRRITVGGGDSDPDYEFEHLYAGNGVGYGSGGGGYGRGRGRGMASYSGRGRPSKAVLAAAAAAGGGGGSVRGGLDINNNHHHHHHHHQYNQLYHDHTGSGNLSHQQQHHPLATSPFSSHQTFNNNNNNAIDDHGGSLIPPPPPAGLLPSLHPLAHINTNDFVGDPVVIRTITRVPSFAALQSTNTSNTTNGIMSSHGGGEVMLPSAVTVRIYLSGSSSPEDGSPTATKDGKECEGDKAKDSVDSDTNNNNNNNNNTVEKKKQQHKDDEDATATMSDTTTTTSKKDNNNNNNNNNKDTKDSSKHQKHPNNKHQRSPASLLQKRLDALDQMARRIGRAQQAIIKGVPIDLPTQIVRSLRTGPPVSLRMQPHGMSPKAGHDHGRSVFGNSGHVSSPTARKSSFIHATQRLSGRQYNQQLFNQQQQHHHHGHHGHHHGQKYRRSLGEDEEESETDVHDEDRRDMMHHRNGGRGRGKGQHDNENEGDDEQEHHDDDEDDGDDDDGVRNNDDDMDIDDDDNDEDGDDEDDEDDSDNEPLFKSSMRLKQRARSTSLPASSSSSSDDEGDGDDDDMEEDDNDDDGDDDGYNNNNEYPVDDDDDDDDGDDERNNNNNNEYSMSTPRSPTIPRGGKIKPGSEEKLLHQQQQEYEQSVVDIGGGKAMVEDEPAVVEMFDLA